MQSSTDSDPIPGISGSVRRLDFYVKDLPPFDKGKKILEC
jgi:hypothetical protein